MSRKNLICQTRYSYAVVCFNSWYMYLWAPKSLNRKQKFKSIKRMSVGMVGALWSSQPEQSLLYNGSRRMFLITSAIQMYGVKKMQGFCCCSASWFQPWAQASYTLSQDGILGTMICICQNRLFSKVEALLLCLSSDLLSCLPSTQICNSKAQINPAWRGLCYFCQPY